MYRKNVALFTMKELEKLTADLLLISETDSGWDILPIENELIVALQKAYPEEKVDFSIREELNPWEFLEKLASPQDWWDEFMQEQGIKYAELLEYIRENYQYVQLFRFGTIKVMTVLLLQNNDGTAVALVAWQVET